MERKKEFGANYCLTPITQAGLGMGKEGLQLYNVKSVWIKKSKFIEGLMSEARRKAMGKDSDLLGLLYASSLSRVGAGDGGDGSK